jgi:hypothetical protein
MYLWKGEGVVAIEFSKLTSKKGLLALKHTFYSLVICEISASMLKKIQLGNIVSSPATTPLSPLPRPVGNILHPKSVKSKLYLKVQSILIIS